MKCSNCGYENMDDNRFCEQCGNAFYRQSESVENNNRTNTNAQATGYNNSQSAGYANANNNQYGAVNSVNANNYNYRSYSATPEIQNSYFDGNMFQLLGWNILCGLITVFTLGFGTPWAMVLKIRWETKHTVINGKRLYFNGTATQLFGKLILWCLLEVAVLAILPIIAAATSSRYAVGANLIVALVVDAIVALFTMPAFSVYIKKWETKHTTFFNDNGMVYSHMASGQIYYAPAPQNFNGYSNQNINYQNQSIQNDCSHKCAAQNNIGNSDTPNNCQQNNNQ